MKLNDIILEDLSLDEISLAGVSQGIGKVVGNVKGSVQGAKNVYQQSSTVSQMLTKFTYWLKQHNKTSDSDSVIEFLKQLGYGSRAIDAARSKLPTEVDTTTSSAASQTQQQKFKKAAQTAQAGMTPKPPKEEPVPQKFGSRGIPGMNEDKLSKIQENSPLNKQQLNDIFSAVAQSQQQTSQPAGQPSTMGNQTASNSVSGQPSNQGIPSFDTGAQSVSTGNAPVINAETIVEYYKATYNDEKNGPALRQSIRDGLDRADNEAKAVDTEKKTMENVGFSRFLGIVL